MTKVGSTLIFNFFGGGVNMTKIRNYFIIMAVVFAITSACALVGVKDVKAAERHCPTSLRG